MFSFKSLSKLSKIIVRDGRGCVNSMLTNTLVKEVQATENNPAGMRGDSNEDEYFNETDFKSAHNISQNSGKPVCAIYGRYKWLQVTKLR